MAGLGKALQAVLCGVVVILVVTAKPVDEVKEDFRMPGVQPQVKDTYLCMPRQMGDEAKYITGFIPHANMTTAHHVLLYGCTEPGDPDKVWSCGEMESSHSEYEQGPVCKEGSKILYAWAMDAPQLTLPKGVGFKVGGDTDVKWLVLQVHYKDVSNFVPPKSQKDNSGITMVTTTQPQPKRAGVYLLGTDGELPPKSTIYMETACGYDDPFEIHPFAFRAHAHGAGRVVAGYRVRDGDWTEIGRVSPQIPQMFYNVTHPGIEVKPGDIMAARCTMTNEQDRTVYIGSTTNDEMCNFYIMYWVAGDHIMSENYCFSEGPPHWYWSDAQVVHSENAPGDVSIVPGSDKVIKATERFFDSVNKHMDDASDSIRDEFADLFAQFQTKYEEPEEEEQQQEEEEEEEYDPALENYLRDTDMDPELMRVLAMQQYPQYFQQQDEDEQLYNNNREY